MVIPSFHTLARESDLPRSCGAGDFPPGVGMGRGEIHDPAAFIVGEPRGLSVAEVNLCFNDGFHAQLYVKNV
jgi:hypothetical protein